MKTRAEFIDTILDLNEDFNNLNEVDKEFVSIALFKLWNHVVRKSQFSKQRYFGIDLEMRARAPSPSAWPSPK